MKVRFWNILALAVCAVLVFAARSYALSIVPIVPKLINFQGKLLNSTGTPLSGSYSVKFSIYHVSSGGSALWTETQSISIPSSNKGIYNVLLGGVNPIDVNSLPLLPFGGDYWLGIKVGSDSEMTPRLRLASVPFAFQAENSNFSMVSEILRCYDTSMGGLQGTIAARRTSLGTETGTVTVSGIGYSSDNHMFFDNSGTLLAGIVMDKGKPLAFFPNDLNAGGGFLSSKIESSGDLWVGGNAHVEGKLVVIGELGVIGIKAFIQQHPTDPTKEIAYVALEGPEAGTYCRGRGKLENGIAVIPLPDTFPLVTSAEAIITTQATPRGDCRGLYVAEASSTQIVIKELQGGKSNIEFDYLVQGVRKGYENNPVIRERTKTKVLPGKAPEAK